MAVEQVLQNREAGIALKAQAVLFRASHHSGPLEVELTRRNIPFVKFGGLKFLEAAHIKDVLAVLRFAENPRDRVAGFRAIQLLPGVGPATAARALDGLSGDDAGRRISPASNRPPRRRRSGRPSPMRCGWCAADSAGWPAEIELVCRWYQPHLERIHDDAVVRQADLIQLMQIAQSYSSRERFLTELTLDPPDATSDEAGVPLLDEDYLILSTIHSAKGQEWKAVFVLNTRRRLHPGRSLRPAPSAEIEEERRLLYVAMTRAKDHLHLIVPQRFYAHTQRGYGDRHMYAARTRFIPVRHSAPFREPRLAARPPPRPEAKIAAAPVDIGARMRRMWR